MGFGYANYAKNDKGCSSSKIAIIVTFINQYIKILYQYTTLSLPNYFWNENDTLFDCYGITTTLKSRFREPPVE